MLRRHPNHIRVVHEEDSEDDEGPEIEENLKLQAEEMKNAQKELDEMLKMSDDIIEESTQNLNQGTKEQRDYQNALIEEDTERMKILTKERPLTGQRNKLTEELVVSKSKREGVSVQKDDRNFELYEELDLSEQNLVDVDDKEVFDARKLKSLQILNLSNNHISSLENFTTCYNLVEIDISGNRIADIRNLNLFMKLKKFYGNDNLFEYLDSFSFVPNLKVLELENNKIMDLGDALNILSELPKLQELVLKNNPVNSIFTFSAPKRL